MQKLIAASAITLALLSGQTISASAATLDFFFTTESGAEGTFSLDTEATPSPDPANFGINPVTGEQITGLSYLNAISNLNLTFSDRDIMLRNERADFEIAPELPSTLLGLPDAQGVLSGAVYPAGCSTGERFTCLFTLGALYSGDVSLLPQLSEKPSDYAVGLGFDYFEPTSGQLIGRDSIDTLTVTKQTSEPGNLISLVGLAIFSVYRLLQINKVSYKKD